MTRETSHAFYSKPSVPPKENSTFVKVIVQPAKITVSERVLRQNGHSEKLSEVVLSRKFYELETNSHGDKYLKVFTQTFESKDGRRYDSTVDLLNLGSVESLLGGFSLRITEFITEPPELKTFLRNSIMRWFSEDSSAPLLPILFPALKDLGESIDPSERLKQSEILRSVLLTMEAEMSEKKFAEVRNALRDSSNWESFIRTVCSEEVVASDEDVATISQHPSLLRLATWKLGFTISEVQKMGETPYSFMITFLSNKVDYSCLQFMLDYLPENQRSGAVTLMFDLSRRYVKAKREGKNNSSFRTGNTWLPKVILPVERVPQTVRPILAQDLLNRLRYGFEPQIANIENGITATWAPVTTDLYETFSKGFAKHVVEPTLKSDLTVDDIENRFKELFGFSFPLEEGSYIHTSRTGKLWTDDSNQVSSLLERLKSPFRNSFSSGFTNKCYYLAESGEYCALHQDIYSLDALMNLIEIAAERINKKLVKLGREVNATNRGAYLNLGHRERNSRTAWRYYDLGVTNAHKIVALKMLKIRSDAEIQMYAQLPDDIFFEILSLIDSHTLDTAHYYGQAKFGATAAHLYLDTMDGLI